ncbi:hypothetical protein L6R21_28055, partial [bacterium]|nr:hypothetical protein [bacterium]
LAQLPQLLDLNLVFSIEGVKKSSLQLCVLGQARGQMKAQVMQQNALVLVGFGHASEFDFCSGFGRQDDVTYLNAPDFVKHFSGLVPQAFALAKLAQCFPKNIG